MPSAVRIQCESNGYSSPKPFRFFDRFCRQSGISVLVNRAASVIKLSSWITQSVNRPRNAPFTESAGIHRVRGEFSYGESLTQQDKLNGRTLRIRHRSWNSSEPAASWGGLTGLRSVRMSHFISFSQAASADMSVDLSCRQTLVAQQLLGRCVSRLLHQASGWRSCDAGCEATFALTDWLSGCVFSSMRPMLRVVRRRPKRFRKIAAVSSGFALESGLRTFIQLSSACVA